MSIICALTSVSEGVMAYKRMENRIGQRNGRLVIVENLVPSEGNKNRGGRWKCQCDCGNTYDSWGYGYTQVYSCGCLRAEHNVSEGRNKRTFAESTKTTYYNRYVHGCRGRGYEPLSREEWFRIAQLPCVYCGQIDVRNHAKTTGYRKRCGVTLTEEVAEQYTAHINGIDRIDSSKGYEPDNCAPCCNMCNCMKLDHDRDDFLAQVERIHAYRCCKQLT